MIFKFSSGFGILSVYLSNSPSARSLGSFSCPSWQVWDVKDGERNSEVALSSLCSTETGSIGTH